MSGTIKLHNATQLLMTGEATKAREEPMTAIFPSQFNFQFHILIHNMCSSCLLSRNFFSRRWRQSQKFTKFRNPLTIGHLSLIVTYTKQPLCPKSIKEECLTYFNQRTRTSCTTSCLLYMCERCTH